MTSTQIACGRARAASAAGTSSPVDDMGGGPRRLCDELSPLSGSQSVGARWAAGGLNRGVCSMLEGLGPTLGRCARGAMLRAACGEQGALQGLRPWKGICCARGVMRGELGSERDGRSRTNGAHVCLCGRSRHWQLQGSPRMLLGLPSAHVICASTNSGGEAGGLHVVVADSGPLRPKQITTNLCMVQQVGNSPQALEVSV